MRSAVCDPKAPCSELRQQWQNLNVQASTGTANRGWIEGAPSSPAVVSDA